MQNVVSEDKTIEAYESEITDTQLETIRENAAPLENVRVAHINSTASGGGVAEIVQSLVPLMAVVSKTRAEPSTGER